METIRRDKLKRLAQAGKLVCIQSYRFDDAYGESHGTKELAVRLSAGSNDFVEGYINLRSDHFTSKSGCAYRNENGTISLIVHSNLNYDFREVK